MTDTSDKALRSSNEHTTVSADWEKAKAAMSGERSIVNTNNPIDRLLAELDEDASDCKRAATSLPGRAAETIRLLVEALSGTPETRAHQIPVRPELCIGKAHIPIATCATCGCFVGSVDDLPKPPTAKASCGELEAARNAANVALTCDGACRYDNYGRLDRDPACSTHGTPSANGAV